MQSVAIPAILIAIALTAAVAPARGDDVQSLIAAERTFADSARVHGIRDAFLSVLDDEGIIFRPAPVKARPWYSARPAPPGLLSWTPEYAEISAGGTLGYTTGPWEFRVAAVDTVAARGHYVSIWTRAKDEPWRLALDLGVSHDGGTPAPGAPVETRVSAIHAAPQTAPEDSLRAVEARMNDLAFRVAPPELLQSHHAEDLRLYRPEHPPALGLLDASRLVTQDEREWTRHHLGCRVASSVDLGYTFGTVGHRSDEDASPGGYVRIWRRGSGSSWIVALEIVLPPPPPAPK